MITNHLALSYYERLKDAYVGTSGSVGRLSHWLQKHTTLHGRPFSFKQHEYQQAIIDSTETTVSVIKPSQTGLSELIARMTLGFLATTPGATAIYGMPSIKDVQRFVKSRIDPVIAASNSLSAMVKTAADSASFKIIGSSQLHSVGFYQGESIISIPTDLLVIDECDFCDDAAIRTAESRLSHSRFLDPQTGVRGMRRVFSTPTGEGIGIAAWFDRSDKRYRFCKCCHCNHWFWPNFLDQGACEGYSKSFNDLTAADVLSLEKRGLVDQAVLLCPACKKPVTVENLGPKYREWVTETPSITGHAGYAVDPFSVPDFNTVPTLMRKLVTYGNDVGNFRNFSLGLAYNDATNSILPEAVGKNTEVLPISPEQAMAGAASGCLMGVDVGKISWVIIAKPFGDQLHILHTEQIYLEGEAGEGLLSRLLYLIKAYKVFFGCIDSYPYSDTVSALVNKASCIKAVEFTARDKTLPMYIAREATMAVNRTKLLDLTVKKVNQGEIKFPMGTETDIVDVHLRALRKAERIKERTNERVFEWLSSKADHYAFALAYTVLANQVLQDNFTLHFAAPVSIKEAYIGKKSAIILPKGGLYHG